jgi:hypothetical protein
VGLLGTVLLHVRLFNLGINLNQLLTFWVPLEVAAFLILYATFSNDNKWVLGLILMFAATLHLVLPLAQNPSYVSTEDAIYGYQLIVNTIRSGNWQFGYVGAGSTNSYSLYPLMFVFIAVWSEVSSIPLTIIAIFGMAFINLTTLLTLRMFNTGLLKLPEKASNLILFLYALTPTIHRVESLLHYEAYAVIFLPIIYMYVLRPRLSMAERIVALITILSVAFSHYFTSYILMLNSVVILISYVILRGDRVQVRLLFLTILAPLAWAGVVAATVFGRNLIQVQSVLANIRSLSSLFGKLTAEAPVATYYPAPWFTQLASIRNGVIMILGLFAIYELCIKRTGFRFKARRADMFAYLAGTWIFSVFFSIAAYYGIAWSETVVASNGPAEASNRIAEFSFLNFSIFSGIGAFALISRIQRRAPAKMREFTKVALCALFIFLFVSTVVVQAYPRVAYDSSYHPIFYDEYSSSFQAGYYLGNWWNTYSNHTYYDRPFTGSRGLSPFIGGYGRQTWWEDNITGPPVNINSATSSAFSAYYAIDTAQLRLPDHLYNMTIDPAYVSSQNTRLNMLFNSGRLVVVNKPSNSTSA